MSLAMLHEMDGKFEKILREDPDEALHLELALYSSPSVDFLRRLRKERSIQTSMAVRYFKECEERRLLGERNCRFSDVLDAYSRIGIVDIGDYVRLTEKGKIFLDIMDLDFEKLKGK